MQVYFAEGCGGIGVLIPKDGELRLARTKPEETLEGCGGKGVLLPKDGELRLARTKPGETLVAVRRLSHACVCILPSLLKVVVEKASLSRKMVNYAWLFCRAL